MGVSGADGVAGDSVGGVGVTLGSFVGYANVTEGEGGDDPIFNFLYLGDDLLNLGTSPLMLGAGHG